MYDTNTSMGRKLIREGLTSNLSEVNLGNILNINKIADKLATALNDRRLSRTHCRALKDVEIKLYTNFYGDFGIEVARALMLKHYERTKEEQNLYYDFRNDSEKYRIDKD